jgi:hypothetical protein
MLVGEKWERVTVEGEDLLRAYSIRPAVRPIQTLTVVPEGLRIGLTALFCLFVPTAAVMVAALVAHLFLPTIR